MSELNVRIGDGRNPETQVSRVRGIYLLPGEVFVGSLPLDVRRGIAILGVHSESDRRTDIPTLVDGKINVADLLLYADEFDGPGDKYSAREFILSILPDVVGTEERRRHLEARNALINPPTSSALASGE